MQGTTQRPRTLVERLLESKQRELAGLTVHYTQDGHPLCQDDRDYMLKLQEDIRWMTAHLAERAEAVQR